MDSFQGFPPLLAIFYSEFHPTQGPKVIYEVPEGFVTSSCSSTAATSSSANNLASAPTPLANPHLSYLVPSNAALNLAQSSQDPILDFDCISEYIIPKPVLCNRLVTISTEGCKVMGYPVSIQDPKYERNALLFNMCFVFEKDADAGSYEQIVRKMARVLRSLEVESEFLYRPTTKSSILNIMEQLLEDLNSYSECQIPINDANMINLKLFPKYRDPPPVHDYQVPVCIVNLEKVMDKYWDMTMRRVIPCIDGVSSVKRISEIADVDVGLVRIAIQHLLFYGCVKLVDIFQFGNIYAVKPAVAHLLGSPEAQKECIDFVAKPGRPHPPTFATIFGLYCSLKHGITVQAWLEESRGPLGAIDVRLVKNVFFHVSGMIYMKTVVDFQYCSRRFILFGVIKGFLYRVHKYPMWLTRSDANDSPNRHLKRYLNGQHHYDELCTLFGCTARELDDVLKTEPAVKFVWR
ncbi:Nitrogen permease regulator 2 [Borealophlyctis nickersoniae]|nr:Nitrogen permease regulator 2 [Borealophlyctis nickersoniae]